MALALHARKAFLADGWAGQVRFEIEHGRIAHLERNVPRAAGDTAVATVIPGIANGHSHAFQRALAGRTEDRSPAHADDFWTWRSRMYALAAAIDAGALTAVARQLYVEMVASGYTAVTEFHYLLSERPGGPPSVAMLDALAAAADDAGIRLTAVPVLYERAGFDEPAPTAGQRRFAATLEAYLAHVAAARERAAGRYRVGVGAHSLRAVGAASLRRIAELAREYDAPLHIHVAEQRREVDACLAALGRRPVRWLLDEFDVDARWCLVHATHLDEAECGALARSGAVVCLCPSTEGNLGDGLFPLERYLAAGGRFAIGSDSHVTVNPFEELRWLEYGRRLVLERRNVAAAPGQRTGRNLFERAVDGGAQAAGLARGRLETGARADLVVLDEADPMLLGHGTESLLDALVFSGLPLPIERVMIGGVWRVIDGRHVLREPARQAYARTLAGLYGDAEQ